ncbi:segregation protein B [Granulicella sp. WH15]|uniref:Asd/ArgC dimerization domain-containing protein n=1 Tax=Granulicella sp. WH15 TaxID=2602070 RepID=UPI0013673C25|nr:Asd/ArgC dimerization domain-containing protein [Granulicella sp. WH15]QHN03815.1 segregation protein B [Granulicella sp. WH15]
MADGMYRIGVVGASSLVGKELGDELNESLLAASDFILLEDEDDAAGQITATGDEAAFIQRIEPGSFDRMDFVFFAGSAADAAKHWQAARRAGASIVDMTYALENEPDVLVRAPWVPQAAASAKPDLRTPAVVPAHPVAVMLALTASRLVSRVGLVNFAATVLEPASQHGREAMDELHQQTINLLSFQNLPKEQYDAQVSFNLLPTLGESAKIDIRGNERRIHRHYAALSGGRLPELVLQMVQAPVFHGYLASVLIELDKPATVAEVEAALAGDYVDVVADESDPPSNLSVAGQEDIMVQVRSATANAEGSTRFWLWLGADNLKLAALTAISCASELRRMRPQGSVQ